MARIQFKHQKVVPCIDFKRKIERISQTVKTEILRLISQIVFFLSLQFWPLLCGIREQERMNEHMNHPYL